MIMGSKMTDKNLFETILKIHEALEYRSVTPEEALQLIDSGVLILEQLRPIVKSWFGRIAIDGAISILRDTKHELKNA